MLIADANPCEELVTAFLCADANPELQSLLPRLPTSWTEISFSCMRQLDFHSRCARHQRRDHWLANVHGAHVGQA